MHNMVYGRFQHKTDTSENWAKATNFTPLDGELIIYSDLNQHKIGDGKTKVNDLPFEGVLVKGAAGNSAVLAGSYEGYKNEAISQVSMALGAATTAGLKGWYYTKVNLNQKMIWLSDERAKGTLGLSIKVDTTTSTTPDSTSFSSGWNVGDKVTIVNGSKYEQCAEIKAINGNVITLDKLPFDSSSIVTSALAIGNYVEPDEFSITAIKITDNSTTKARTVTSYDKGAVDFGGGSHAEGVQSYALNIGTHAEGIQTVAYGQFAHTEGFKTEAGYAGHAEGGETKATGTYSHAEGRQSTASGYISHAEGSETNATNDYTHAEGYRTTASGIASHAEGNGTHATKFGAHAEGINSQATGERSHAEGSGTLAQGTAAHAEGIDTYATGEYAHSEGQSTRSSGIASHAEGATTQAINNYAHAEGYGSVASGSRAHAEGNNTIASGDFSHASGNGTVAGYNSQTVIGRYNEVGDAAFIIGNGSSESDRTNAAIVDWYGNAYFAGNIYSNAAIYASNVYSNGAKLPSKGEVINEITTRISGLASEIYVNERINTVSTYVDETVNSVARTLYITAGNVPGNGVGACATVEGSQNIASGDYAHAEGLGTRARNLAAHAEGQNAVAEGEAAHAEGCTTKATGKYSHAEGRGTEASGARSHAEGDGCKATADFTHAEGFGTEASLIYAHAEGCNTHATGHATHAEGGDTTASGTYSHAEGCWTVASGARSHAEGEGCQAIGDFSHAEGSCTVAKAHYSHASGYYTTTDRDFQTVVGRSNLPDTEALFVVGAGRPNEEGDPFYSNKGNAFAAGDDGVNYYIKVGETKLTETELQNIKDNSENSGGGTSDNSPSMQFIEGGQSLTMPEGTDNVLVLGNQLVAVKNWALFLGELKLFVSDDLGVNWQDYTAYIPQVESSDYCFYACNGKIFLGIGRNEMTRLYVSDDAISWIEINLSSVSNSISSIYGVVCVNDTWYIDLYYGTYCVLTKDNNYNFYDIPEFSDARAADFSATNTDAFAIIRIWAEYRRNKLYNLVTGDIIDYTDFSSNMAPYSDIALRTVGDTIVIAYEDLEGENCVIISHDKGATFAEVDKSWYHATLLYNNIICGYETYSEDNGATWKEIPRELKCLKKICQGMLVGISGKTNPETGNYEYYLLEGYHPAKMYPTASARVVQECQDITSELKRLFASDDAGNDSDGSNDYTGAKGYITVGETTITEADFIKVLKFINTIE